MGVLSGVNFLPNSDLPSQISVCHANAGHVQACVQARTRAAVQLTIGKNVEWKNEEN